MQQTVEPVRRANVSAAVAEAVRAMIVDGRLPEGARVNEVRLAESIGVSRTPLREALSRLVAEGALTSTPSLGFFVRPLTLEEFEQVYDIRPVLDPHALRLAGIPARKQIERLERLNRKLAAARGPEAAIALDDEWHLELLAHCPNRVLIELIETMMARTRRYEIALMRETRSVARATADHGSVLAALRDGDLDRACEALERNLRSGREPVVAWLRARNARPVDRR
jgi:DNA-binding GntR family transcriptional regulator